MPSLRAPSGRTIQGTALIPSSWAVITRRCTGSRSQTGFWAVAAVKEWRR